MSGNFSTPLGLAYEELRSENEALKERIMSLQAVLNLQENRILTLKQENERLKVILKDSRERALQTLRTNCSPSGLLAIREAEQSIRECMRY